MTTFNWTVEWMNTTPVASNPSECVIAVGWKCAAVDGQYQTVASGVCNLFYKPGSAYTPYQNLTQSQVLKWCWDAAKEHFVDAEGNKVYTNPTGVNKEATERALQQTINNQKQPPVIQPPLPWSA
jgi:hypothetical protein